MKEKSIWSLLLAIGYVVFKMIQVFGRSHERNESELEEPTSHGKTRQHPTPLEQDQQASEMPHESAKTGEKGFPLPVPPRSPYTGSPQASPAPYTPYPGEKKPKPRAPTEEGGYPGLETLITPTKTNSYPGRTLLTSPTDGLSYVAKKQPDSPAGPIQGSIGGDKIFHTQLYLSYRLKKYKPLQKGLILIEIFNPRYER
jgi:hypothetical protein